ncbi:MAG TPA: hypothetical protein VM756_09950 [Burkholderiales bacterium]|nr:hypothetical protein [Burkholderiales bacterium]
MEERPALFPLAPTLILAQQIAALAIESRLTDEERVAALRIAVELIDLPVVREPAPVSS